MGLTEAREGRGKHRRSGIAPAVGLPDVGQIGNPYAPVVIAFQQQGVKLRPDTISQIRKGTTSGLEIVRALAAAEIVATDRIPAKDIFFTEYGALGIQSRVRRTDDRSRTFRSRGLRIQLASELGVNGGILGDLVRALRIDLFYTPADQLGASFRTCFKTTVEAYLRDLRKYGDNQKAKEITGKWNKAKTVKNFYGIMLNEPREVVTGWTPYEMEPIWTLAKNRADHHSPLTPFDMMVLNGINGDHSDEAIIIKIKADIGITIYRQVIDYYRALLMGRIQAKAQRTGPLNTEAQDLEQS